MVPAKANLLARLHLLAYLKLYPIVYVRMRSNLMPFRNHALNQGCVVVYVAPILPVEHKSSLDAIGCELVENLTGVDVRTVIESQCNSTWNGAALDYGSERYSRWR